MDKFMPGDKGPNVIDSAARSSGFCERKTTRNDKNSIFERHKETTRAELTSRRANYSSGFKILHGTPRAYFKRFFFLASGFLLEEIHKLLITFSCVFFERVLY
jgi:hypothetical protein